MPKRIEYTSGQKVGECTYLNEVAAKNKRRMANFRCSCGKEFVVAIIAISGGYTKSCGHRRGDSIKKHGHSTKGYRSPEYKSWQSMKTRCYCKGSRAYPNYGGRGIGVCAEWHKFSGFIADMGIMPTPRHTIERVDNNKGYSKENCKWATRTEQCRNTRSNRRITFNGETKCLSEWAEKIGIGQAALSTRIDRWPLEMAMTKPPRKQKSGHRI